MSIHPWVLRFFAWELAMLGVFVLCVAFVEIFAANRRINKDAN